MHQVYQDLSGSTPTTYSRLIIGNHNRRNAQHEFVRKRSKQTSITKYNNAQYVLHQSIKINH